MSDKNIEMMKKIIEEKKKKSSEQGFNSRANTNIAEIRNGFRKSKNGGLFGK